MSIADRFKNMLRWLSILPPLPPSKNVLIIGFDASGKTTLINALANGRPIRSEMPTIGFQTETLELLGTKFTTICMPCTGSDKTFVLSRHFSDVADALIWVCPKNHGDCFKNGQHRIEYILKHLKTEDVPLLILCHESMREC